MMLTQLTYNEALFILDEDIYKDKKKKFLAFNNGTYKISDSLSNLLKELDISVNDTFKHYEPLIINRDLVKKISTGDNFHFYHRRHIHFDPRKEIEMIQEFIKTHQDFKNTNEQII